MEKLVNIKSFTNLMEDKRKEGPFVLKRLGKSTQILDK